MPQTNPKDNRKKLYEGLKQTGDYNGTIEQFESDYSDPDKLQNVLYKGLRDAGDITDTEYSDFESAYFSDVIKKKNPFAQALEKPTPPSDPLSESIADFSSRRSSTVDVPTAAISYKPHAAQEAAALARQKHKNKDAEDQNKQIEGMVSFYDKISPTLSNDPKGPMVAYKNWAAENGQLDRYIYLQDKSKVEAQDKQRALGLGVESIKQWTEEKRKALVAGDSEKVYELNDKIQSATEYLRDNKHAVDSSDPRTEAGLQLWEESVGFTSNMLNAKMDVLMKDPETQGNITKLHSLKEQLQQDPSNEALVNAYNEILQSPKIAAVNTLSTQSNNLIETEKGFAAKYPDIFEKRLKKVRDQGMTDALFNQNKALHVFGLANQVGGSFVEAIGDFLKIPTTIAGTVSPDNKYGDADKWDNVVDGLVNQFTPAVPTEYSKPLFYKDKNGNNVFRSDLLLPKVAKVAGDMSTLLYGAGKLSGLTKAAGLSNKISAGVGLFSSSYLTSYGDYKKSGLAAGMNPKDAELFATASAGVTSALELVSPNKYLWSQGSDEIAKRVVSNVATGMSKSAAIKSAISTVGREIGGENLQELTQMIGDKAIQAGANIVSGNNYFDQNADKMLEEAMETMVLTTLVAGSPAVGVGALDVANRDQNYRDSLHLVAENRDRYMPLLQDAFKQSNATPEQVKRVLDDVNAVQVPQSGAPLYKIDDQVVTRDSVEAKIKAGEIESVYVANDQELQNMIQNPSLIKEEVKEEPKEEKVESVPEEDPSDKAKRVAKQKINALAESGDVRFDGKKATVLTEYGGAQLATIKSELNKALAEASTLPPPPPKETKGDKKEPATPIQVEGANLNLREFEATEKDPERKRIAQVLGRAKKSLSSINPNTKVALFDGTEQGTILLKNIGSKKKMTESAAGFYDRDSGTLGIDLSKANATTAFHEAFHPIVDFVKTEKPELFTQLSEEAGEVKLELEDGKIIPYSEYTKGDKEEALVEFLSDYADGAFDNINNPDSVLAKVKKILNQVLQAVGLKSSDFNVNLDNIKDLKAFADQMSQAIGQGKVIKFNTEASKKATGTVFQQTGPKKKLNRTAKTIANDKETQYKNLQSDILTNPEDYSYVPQDLSTKKKSLEGMTLDEVVVETQSMDKLLDALGQNNQYSILSALELLDRYNKQNLDTRPIFKKLREIGTGVGQLLRQFGELKKAKTPEMIVFTIGKNLESLNLEMTKEQTDLAMKLAKDYTDAIAKREAERVDYLENPSTEKEKSLQASEDQETEAFTKLNEFISQVTPLGVDSMLGTILQGNLLTPKSIVTNVISNLVQQPIRQLELAAGDLATYVLNRMKGASVMSPIEVYYGAALNGMEQSALGVGRAIKDVASGRGAESTSTLEVRRNLKPLQALQQLFTKAGRATLPVNSKGKTPISVYIEKALEGTAGWPAEAMFRMLYLGDKPFKDGAKMAGAYRLFAEGGGKSNADFKKFMANITPKQQKQLQAYADDATFSNERTVSKMADNFVNMVNRNIDALAEITPNETYKQSFKALAKFIAKANTPFVRIPSNLLQYLIELAIPAVPLYGAAYYAKKGDVRKSSQLFVRAAVGGSMYYLANMMYDAGVMIASGEGDDDNEKQLKHEIGRPNGINIDALGRFTSGTNTPSNSFQEGDRIVDFTKLGLFGMFLAYHAEWNESLQKEQKVTRQDASVVDQLSRGFGSISRTALEMSFLQGTFVALDALRKGSMENYFAELTNTMTALIIPNTVSTSTRARAEYMLRADDKSTIQKFMEKQSIKINPALKDNITGVYPIIGMFGDPVKQTPKDGTFGENNPWIYQFFDITNGKAISDPVALEVFNLSKRIGSVPITIPTPRIEVMEKPYNMTEQDFVQTQMFAGMYKRVVIQELLASEDWATMSDEEKNIALKKVNSKANETAREYMLGQIYEGLEVGNITLDEKLGKYTYKQQSEFDFDYAKKILKDGN